jgi:hypothetical protein
MSIVDPKAFSEIVAEAMSELGVMKKPVIQFCAPISSGGFGSTDENVAVLKHTISGAASLGISVFDQLKYEPAFNVLLNEFEGDYDYPLLQLFYEPLFKSGKIQGLFFLPLWETSCGSVWEYQLAQSLGIKTEIIETMLLSEIENKYSDLANSIFSKKP